MFEWNHLGFEHLGTFHHQSCVKWPWIWNESTLQIFGLRWCHRQIWVLFSWLIMISSRPLMYLCLSSAITREALHICSSLPYEGVQGSGSAPAPLLSVGRGWVRAGIFIWEPLWINAFAFVYVNLSWVPIGVDSMPRVTVINRIPWKYQGWQIWRLSKK